MGNQHPLNEKKGGIRSPTIRKLAKDGATWTPTEQVTRNRVMKQFCKAGRKGVEVSSGNSEAFQRGWDAAFGSPEVRARALAEIEAEKATGDPYAVRVVSDPAMPPGEGEFRDEQGRCLLRITGIEP